MLIIHVTDSHASASTPDRPSPRRWRRGTYEDDVMAKLDWVAQRARQLNDETDGHVVVWHTGDIFDRAIEPLRATLRVADWARQLGDHNIPLLCTLGQHDIKAYNLASAAECSVGVLYRLGDGYTPCVMGGVQGEHSIVYGLNCASLHVGADNLLTTVDPEILRGVDVVGTHLSIHHNSFGCVHPRDIHWPVKLVLCAHIHAGMPVCEYNGTTYSAPGALVRLNADEVERTPQISVIRLDEKGDVFDVTYETVPHKPASEVFDLQAMDESVVVEQQRTEFRQAIDAVQEQQAAVGDWRTQVENARAQVGDDVVGRLTTYCEKAEGQ